MIIGEDAMKKINIDGKFYTLMELNIELIEGEYLAYNSEMETIIVFNKTASIIWDSIIEATKGSGIITTNEICDIIMNKYSIPENKFNTITTDVKELLLCFLDKKIISVCEDLK